MTIALLVASAACIAQESSDRQNPLVGVWRVAEVKTVTADSESTNSTPLPGLYIFTQGHYSAVWSTSDAPRQMYEDRWQPTADEKIAAYDSIVVNAGTYELKGSDLVTKPIMARVPGFGGGKALWKYRVDGDDLYLEMFEEYTKDGIRAEWLDYSIFRSSLSGLNE
jgi:hypothetical protein